MMMGEATTATTTMIERQPVPLRHEWKHQISLQEDLVLSQRLRRLFPRDPHAGVDGTYRVTSLYFDTPYDSALREKLDGVDFREKFRLRYYGESPRSFRLEKKFKRHGLCGKRSVQMAQEQVQQLLSGTDPFLLESGEPLFMELYGKLHGKLLAPKTVVSYQREAFLYFPGNVRITLDRRVCTCLSWKDFLHPERFSLEAAATFSVLEVKYDAFLPEIVQMAVQVPNRQASACSKYALCRRFD